MSHLSCPDDDDDALSLLVGGSKWSLNTLQKLLPMSYENVRSDTGGQGIAILRGLKIPL